MVPFDKIRTHSNPISKNYFALGQRTHSFSNFCCESKWGCPVRAINGHQVSFSYFWHNGKHPNILIGEKIMNLTVHNAKFPPISTGAITYSKLADADYLAMMCHDIATPLSAIIGLTHILANEQCSPQKKNECVAMLNDSSAMIMGLMKNMLDLAKIESGRFELEEIHFDLAASVMAAAHIITPKAEEKGLNLYVTIGQFPQYMVGDSLRIRQIILNLLSNAVKFTHSGCISLDVQAVPDATGWQLRIAVTDTGMGMTPPQMARIFNKYEQADQSITRNYGGTGLGLTICRDLAQMMGGDILVESTPGMGSCFTALPIASASNRNGQP
jgi:signal transduction histidine kinase